MGGYVVAASFFTLGLASWQVLLCLLVGICIVQLCANLVAKPSQMAGVPYAVISRQAFGVFWGEHSGGDPRAYRLCVVWHPDLPQYANALMLVALKFTKPSLSSLTTGAFLGLSTSGLDLLRHHVGIAGEWFSGTGRAPSSASLISPVRRST